MGYTGITCRLVVQRFRYSTQMGSSGQEDKSAKFTVVRLLMASRIRLPPQRRL